MEATRESVWQVAVWWHQTALKILTGGRPVKLAYWLRWRQLLGFLTRQADVLFPDSRRTRSTGRQLRDPELRECLRDTELGVWALDADTLNYLGKRLQRERPRVILECGCGASTLLLSLYARSREAGEVIIVSLEQSASYLESVRRRLAEVGLDTPAHLLLVPLNAVDQYQLPGDALTRVLGNRTIDWIVIDAPSGRPACRINTLPMLAPYCRAGTRWFLDDAFRDGELDILRNWARQPEFGVQGIVPIGKGLATGVIRK